jgi:hypothetical protein
MSPRCSHIILDPHRPDIQSCKGKCSYGPYCYKHRSDYLLRDGRIRLDRFTGLSKDYLVKDLVTFTKEYPLLGREILPHQTKKAELFAKVQGIIGLLTHYENPHSKRRVIGIQAIARKRSVLKKQACYSCNNLEDFYTFEPLRSIPVKYYYSYVDLKGHRWGFDIRSLQKLIQMGQPNPYTMTPFSAQVKGHIKASFRTLRRSASFEQVDQGPVRSREDELKQRVVDLFALMERYGYTGSIDWFMCLTRTGLRDMYRHLEDIWNHRAQLTREQKIEIAPPNGRLCRTPMSQVMNMTDKLDLQYLVMEEAQKLTRSPSEGTQTLGVMYILIALGSVSPECAEAHAWLAYVIGY